MQIDIQNIKYKFHFKNNGGNMPCTVDLILGEFLVKGFRIISSEKAPNKFIFYPPANRTSNGNWIKIFWTDNKELWNQLSEDVLKEFEVENIKNYLQ